MSNHNKIRPVDKKDLKGKYKILFSTPQSKNSKIPLKFRGLQIFKNKHAKLKIFDDLNYECEGMFFDIISEDLKFYLGKKSNFDCFFKVKKDSYSNKTVIHLEDIH